MISSTAAGVASERELHELEQGFAHFNDVARSLQAAFSKLERRAAAVEGRLGKANASLMRKVDELEAVTGELNDLLEAIPCGVVASDGEGVIFRVNPAAERLLGRPAGELVGRSLQSVGGGEPLLLMQDTVAPLGTTIAREVTCLDGSVRHLESTLAALGHGGRLEVIADRTEVAHLRSQVHRLDHLAALGEMAAGVAHEIRNPMNGIEGFAGLLEKGLAEETLPREAGLRYVGRIRQGMAEVNGIISNLLVWARPETVQPQTVPLRGLLDEALEEARRLAEASGRRVDFRLRLDGVERLDLNADRLKVKLAVGNLLRNALEVAVSTVELSGERKDGALRLCIDDDGPGVDARVAAKLFAPFVTTKPSGTGLGLAITRKLIGLHDGEVSLVSGRLGGACFEIRLPASVMEGMR